MHWIAEFYCTTPGKKSVMAVTGVILFAYVFLHMLGNLQIHMGPEVFSGYVRVLHAAAGLLWTVRLVLLVSVLLHIIAAVQLTVRNWGSRPIRYAVRRYRETDYASRTMILTGLAIAVFGVYHVLHFTLGSVHPDFIRGDVYHNVITGLRVPPLSLLYIAASAVLGLHLYHGLWSVFQTIGLSNPIYNSWRHAFATVFSLAVALGFVSIPLAVLLQTLP